MHTNTANIAISLLFVSIPVINCSNPINKWIEQKMNLFYLTFQFGRSKSSICILFEMFNFQLILSYLASTILPFYQIFSDVITSFCNWNWNHHRHTFYYCLIKWNRIIKRGKLHKIRLKMFFFSTTKMRLHLLLVLSNWLAKISNVNYN